jgi:tRNA modification GTPase
MTQTHDTIAAVATPAGTGGIAVIRISGPDATAIMDGAWHGRRLSEAVSHSAHLGRYVATDGTVLDECVATVFRAPGTFTGEDVVELGVHGSRWIQREILSDLIRRGARTAGPGEFTQRAFMNGRLDLAQAEGVADLIAASSKAAHTLAMTQTRGGFSKELEGLREKLIEFASLLELELDFSEEDVEFADRTNLLSLSTAVLGKVDRLARSYSSGAALKDGIPVVIAGVPNAGKSSLLNRILGEDKAIVSDIPGTTRDTIEDTVEIEGILYRFVDTAGLRESDDAVESIGIARARRKLEESRIVVWLIDPTSPLSPQHKELREFLERGDAAKVIVAESKCDVADCGTSEETGRDFGSSAKMGSDFGISEERGTDFRISVGTGTADAFSAGFFSELDGKIVRISAKTGEGIDELFRRLGELATADFDPNAELMVTNARHYESLVRGAESLRRAIDGLQTGLSADFVAQDVREALHHLGTITGSVTTDNLLHSIFSRFCIGK